MKKFLTVTIAVLAALSLASAAQASTAGQRNALSSAQSYLRSGAFSKSGLIGQLKYERFSSSEARWAVAHVRVSWNAEAVQSAKSYLRSASFSRQGLIEQLEYEGFTHSQAVDGVRKAYRLAFLASQRQHAETRSEQGLRETSRRCADAAARRWDHDAEVGNGRSERGRPLSFVPSANVARYPLQGGRVLAVGARAIGEPRVDSEPLRLGQRLLEDLEVEELALCLRVVATAQPRLAADVRELDVEREAHRLAEAHVAERQVGLLTGADCCALRGGPRRWSIGRLRVGVAELEVGVDYEGRPDADIDHWEDEQPVVDLGLVAHAVRQGHEHRPLRLRKLYRPLLHGRPGVDGESEGRDGE